MLSGCFFFLFSFETFYFFALSHFLLCPYTRKKEEEEEEEEKKTWVDYSGVASRTYIKVEWRCVVSCIVLNGFPTKLRLCVCLHSLSRPRPIEKHSMG